MPRSIRPMAPCKSRCQFLCSTEIREAFVRPRASGLRRNAIQSLELDLQGRLAPVFERYQNARQQVTSYEEEIIPNAKETLELVKASYQAGEVGYLNMLTAQRTFFQTNLAYREIAAPTLVRDWDIEGLLVATLRGEEPGPHSRGRICLG